MGQNKIYTFPSIFLQFPLAQYILPVFIGFLVYYILAVLEPFGVNLSTTADKELRLIGVGVIPALVVHVCQNLIPIHLDGIANHEQWSLKTGLLYLFLGFLLAAILCSIYIVLVFPGDPAAPSFWECIWYSYLIGISPVVIIVLWNHIIILNYGNRAYPSQVDDTAEIVQIDKDQSLEISKGQYVAMSDIVLLTARGNYISIYYLEGADLKKSMIRKTISSITQELPSASFVRCHRSHLVNMSYFVGVEGNSKGLKLSIKHLEEDILVSRSYVAIVREWVALNHKS